MLKLVYNIILKIIIIKHIMFNFYMLKIVKKVNIYSYYIIIINIINSFIFKLFININSMLKYSIKINFLKQIYIF